MLRVSWVGCDLQLLIMTGKRTINQTVLPPGLGGAFLSDQSTDFMVVGNDPPPAAGAAHERDTGG